MSNKSLYVGNLSYSATEENLRELFAQWGPVSEARIVAGRGFGFVDLPAENAQAAIDATHDKDFQGRTLTVNEAKPRSERRSGGGGGYGGGNGGYGGGSGGGSRSRGPRW